METARYGQFGRDGIYNILDTGKDGVCFSWEDGLMHGADSTVPCGAAFGPHNAAMGVIHAISDTRH